MSNRDLTKLTIHARLTEYNIKIINQLFAYLMLMMIMMMVDKKANVQVN